MGINNWVAHTMLAMHREEGFAPGEQVGVAGRQTVFLPNAFICNVAECYGMDAEAVSASLTRAAVDMETRRTRGNISDAGFFETLFQLRLTSIDSSDYEAANTVLDLNEYFDPSLTSNLLGQCELVYDGGSLDNVFDPATAIKNLASMLAPGGRIVNWVCASNWPGAFAMVSPEWLYAFYSLNNFRDIRIYLVTIPEDGANWPNPSARFFRYSPYFTRSSDWNPLRAVQADPGHPAFVLAVAKTTQVRLPNEWKNPMQSHYLTEQDLDWRVRTSPDGELDITFDEREDTAAVGRPFDSDHFRYVGTLRGF